MSKNILIGFFIVMVGLLGGLLIASDNNADMIARKAECQRLGEAQHNKHLEEFAADIPTASMFRPEYTYSPTLHMCLYASGSVQPAEDGGIFVQKWVIDIYTNQELFGFYAVNDSLIPGSLTKDEFDRRKLELFKEDI